MQAKDFYKILGVNEKASADEIKKAYRKLAKENHPDANQGNKQAEERFKEISQAYDVLGDSQKRRKYDQMRKFGGGRGGFDFGKGAQFDGFDLSDLFGGGMRAGNVKFTPGVYQNNRRIIVHNVNYIANLIALINWYRFVRPLFVSNAFKDEMIEGLVQTLSVGINERIKRLKAFVEKASKASDGKLSKFWPAFEESLNRTLRGSHAYVHMVEADKNASRNENL